MSVFSSIWTTENDKVDVAWSYHGDQIRLYVHEQDSEDIHIHEKEACIYLTIEEAQDLVARINLGIEKALR